MTTFEKSLLGGLGCGVSGFLTNPCDVIKIRNQQFGNVISKYGTFPSTLQAILAEEGYVNGLLKGAKPNVARDFWYSGIRFGWYEPIKQGVIRGYESALGGNDPQSAGELSRSPSGSQGDPIVVKYGSAFLSGGIAAALTNPIDLVKVRIQTHVHPDPRKIPHQNSLLRGFWEISHGTMSTVESAEAEASMGVRGRQKKVDGASPKVVKNGVAEEEPKSKDKAAAKKAQPKARAPTNFDPLRLYAGVGATVLRAACVTAGQLGSYDVIKNDFLCKGGKYDLLNLDRADFSTHCIASMLASLIATTIANPADVVKTRVMNDVDARSSLWWARRMLRDEGPSVFMKGWTASYLRIGPHTIISLVLVEHLRKLYGIDTY